MFFGKKRKRKIAVPDQKQDPDSKSAISEQKSVDGDKSTRKISLPDDSTNLGYWLLIHSDYFGGDSYVQKDQNSKEPVASGLGSSKNAGSEKEAVQPLRKFRFAFWFIFSLILTLMQILVIKVVVDDFVEGLLESYQMQREANKVSKQEFVQANFNESDSVAALEDVYFRAHVDLSVGGPNTTKVLLLKITQWFMIYLTFSETIYDATRKFGILLDCNERFSQNKDKRLLFWIALVML